MKIFPIMSSPLLCKFPVKLLFQSIALMAFQNSVILQPAHDDTRPDTDRFREIVYGVVGENARANEIRERARRNQRIGGETARLLLVPMHLGIHNMIGQILGRIVENERTLVPVTQD